MAPSRGNAAQGLPDTLALPSPKEQVFFKGALSIDGATQKIL